MWMLSGGRQCSEEHRGPLIVFNLKPQILFSISYRLICFPPPAALNLPWPTFLFFFYSIFPLSSSHKMISISLSPAFVWFHSFLWAFWAERIDVGCLPKEENWIHILRRNKEGFRRVSHHGVVKMLISVLFCFVILDLGHMEIWLLSTLVSMKWRVLIPIGWHDLITLFLASRRMKDDNCNWDSAACRSRPVCDIIGHRCILRKEQEVDFFSRSSSNWHNSPYR